MTAITTPMTTVSSATSAQGEWAAKGQCGLDRGDPDGGVDQRPGDTADQHRDRVPDPWHPDKAGGRIDDRLQANGEKGARHQRGAPTVERGDRPGGPGAGDLGGELVCRTPAVTPRPSQ